MRMTPEEALKAAIEIVGGHSALAAILGTSHQYIHQLKRCPAARIPEVMAAIGQAKERVRNAPTERDLRGPKSR